MKDIDICKAGICAQNIADNWKVAYWTTEKRSVFDMKAKDAHDEFKKLAELMGYRVELK